jgi:hypothetical protein
MLMRLLCALMHRLSRDFRIVLIFHFFLVYPITLSTSAHTVSNNMALSGQRIGYAMQGVSRDKLFGDTVVKALYY